MLSDSLFWCVLYNKATSVYRPSFDVALLAFCLIVKQDKNVQKEIFTLSS